MIEELSFNIDELPPRFATEIWRVYSYAIAISTDSLRRDTAVIMLEMIEELFTEYGIVTPPDSTRGHKIRYNFYTQEHYTAFLLIWG